MTRAPSRVQVGPLEYRVRTVSRESLDGDFGECDHDAFVIRLGRGLRAPARREVLWHEVGHAVADYCQLGLTPKQEERVMRAFMPALLDTLRRNEQLRHYVLAECGKREGGSSEAKRPEADAPSFPADGQHRAEQEAAPEGDEGGHDHVG
jgi:hypothetical protein